MALIDVHLRRRLRAPLSTALLALGIAALPACADDGKAPGSEVPRSVGEPADPAAPADHAAPAGDGLAAGSEATRAPARPVEAGRAGIVRRVRRVFDDWAEKEARLVQSYAEGAKEAVGKLRMYKRLTTKAYESRDYRPFWSADGQLTEAGDHVVEALYAVTDHGLDPAPYDLEGLRALVKGFSDASLAYQNALTLPSEDKVVWDFLTAQRKRLPLDDVGLERAAAAAGIDDRDLAVVDRAAGHVDALMAGRGALNETLRDLDIGLTWRYLRYIYDMRFSLRAHPFKADATDGAGIERTADDVYAFFLASDFEHIDATLASLVPKLPDYKAVMAGLQRYRKFAETYPEEPELSAKVEKLKRVAKPKPDELVRAVQTRLQHEDYYDGPLDGLYGEALEAALNFYQETHQLEQTGRVDRQTRLSLNRSYGERVQQLELSLRRFRESELHQGKWPFGSTPLRGRVNIPAFQATFFKDGVAVRQHNIIVGNNAVEVDAESGRKGLFNHTRMFSAELATVVLNPVWRVPKRIKEQELDLKLMDEPDFYEKHNYEVKTLPDGTEQVTQRSGSGNALGLVKFLFPNEFAIYMHDTPNKRLFKRNIRAFSHGCMRTEDPLELARWLLVDQGDWTAERFQQVLDSRQEYGVALKNKVPITIDYNTVGVHSSGRMMFYSDIYRYDKAYFEGNVPFRQDRDHPLTIIY